MKVEFRNKLSKATHKRDLNNLDLIFRFVFADPYVHILNIYSYILKYIS